MRKILLLIFALPISLHAKEVYFADSDGVKMSEAVDPSVKLWYLKDYLFRLKNIDLKRFALGIKTSRGFYRPNPEKALEEFGRPNEPILFHIVSIDDEGKVDEQIKVKIKDQP